MAQLFAGQSPREADAKAALDAELARLEAGGADLTRLRERITTWVGALLVDALGTVDHPDAGIAARARTDGPALRAEVENLRRALCVVGAYLAGEPGYTRVRAVVAGGDALEGTRVDDPERRPVAP